MHVGKTRRRPASPRRIRELRLVAATVLSQDPLLKNEVSHAVSSGQVIHVPATADYVFLRWHDQYGTLKCSDRLYVHGKLQQVGLDQWNWVGRSFIFPLHSQDIVTPPAGYNYHIVILRDEDCILHLVIRYK